MTRLIVGTASPWNAYDVELNGETVPGWVEADDEEGYVLIPSPGPDGIWGTDDDDNVMVERKEGAVVFKPRPE